MRAAEICQFRQWVDHSTRCCSGGTNDHERQKSFLTILSNSLRKIREVYFQMPVCRHRPDSGAPQDDHMRDLDKGVVALVGHINRRPAGQSTHTTGGVLRKRPSQCDNSCGEIRFGAATCEIRDGGIRQAEFTGQPRKNVTLDFVSGGRSAPRCKLRVVHRDECVPNNGGWCNTRVKQSHVPWMCYLDMPCAQHPLDIRSDFGQSHRACEIVSRRQVATNLGRLYVWYNWPGSDSGFHFLYRAYKFIKMDHWIDSATTNRPSG